MCDKCVTSVRCDGCGMCGRHDELHPVVDKVLQCLGRELTIDKCDLALLDLFVKERDGLPDMVK